MVNQKEIRVKISSTKKTMKITSAMKLVAAAKVNKMQKILSQARPYAKKIQELFSNLQSVLSEEEKSQQALLKRKADLTKVLLVVITSDRGLCGGYNASIIKNATKKIKELKQQNNEVKLITVGRKARAAFTKEIFRQMGVEILESFVNLNSIPNTQEASLIANKAIEFYLNEVVDKVEIISTRFISLVNNEVQIKSFLPIESVKSDQKESEPYVLLEPDAKTLVETLLPMYIENTVYQALLESITSELASRMTAMSSATNNAKEFIRKLVLAYNKARQANITQEISEIVGGAAALG